jgi:hypothetical protein
MGEDAGYIKRRRTKRLTSLPKFEDTRRSKDFGASLQSSPQESPAAITSTDIKPDLRAVSWQTCGTNFCVHRSIRI